MSHYTIPDILAFLTISGLGYEETMEQFGQVAKQMDRHTRTREAQVGHLNWHSRNDLRGDGIAALGLLVSLRQIVPNMSSTIAVDIAET